MHDAAQVRTVSMSTLQPDAWREAPVGVPVQDTMPPHDERQMIVLRVNGQCIARAGWSEPIEPGMHIEWLLDAPADRESFRTVLQVAAVAVAIVAPEFAPYLAGAAAAYNLLVPPHQPDAGAPAADVFTASVGGNVARLDDPIWRTYGIDKITPPFAGQPYTEFLDIDGDNINNDQYFFAVLAVGVGPYKLLADFLGKTPVSHYVDVLEHRLLLPGELPLRAKANVWVSQDIGNFELKPRVSPGSYAACPPLRTIGFLGIDIVADQGLGWIDSDGDARNVTVEWAVQIRDIDDAGAPLGRFVTIANESISLNTNTIQRWSGKYLISPPRRVEARVFRTNDLTNNDATTRDSIQWVGMRGYGADLASLNPNVSHYELVLRATQNLSQINQSAISMIVQGGIRTWNPDDGWNCASGDWANYVYDDARSPAWPLADVASDSVYGEGLPDERIDLQGLYDLDQVWRARQDRCDYTFSNTTDAWSAGQLLARTGRARMFRRYGVRCWKRDQHEDLPVTMFTPRMCVAGTKMSVDEQLPDEQAGYDGIIVQYRSNAKWDQDLIECPCPGISVITKPVYRQYPGIQGRTHAEREGLYDAADMALRRRTVSLTTEMHAELAAFLDPVLWQPQIVDYGQSGDVVDWDGDRVLELTEAIEFVVGGTQIMLQRDDGSLFGPVDVSPGSDAYHVTLSTAPDFDLVCDDARRERPRFIVPTIGAAELVKVANISDGGQSSGGAPYWKVTAVPDDDRVHAADNSLLPGPGDVQDPIGLPGDGAGTGGGDEIIYLHGVDFGDGDFLSGGGNGVGIDMTNTGHMSLYTDAAPHESFDLPSQWAGSIDPTVAATYEVMVSIDATVPTDLTPFLVGDAVDTWLSLGTDRSWHIIAGTALDRNPVRFTVRIRYAPDSSTQATAIYIGTINASNLH